MLADCYECGEKISTEASRCPYCGYYYQYTTYTRTESGLKRREGDDYGDDERGSRREGDPVGGCFIATAAYGTPLAEEIGVLRKFRDENLARYLIGRVFIASYYRLSPPIAAIIKQSNVLRAITRAALRPVVWLLEKMK